VTVAQKLEIVLAGLRGEVSVAEVCREHQISETLFYSWREKLLEGGAERLAGKEEWSMIVRGDVERQTRDLDFFGLSTDAVDQLLPAVDRALQAAGLVVRRIQESPGFARLIVESDEDRTELDLGADARLFPAEPRSPAHGRLRIRQPRRRQLLTGRPGDREEAIGEVIYHAHRLHGSSSKRHLLTASVRNGFASSARR
jgi:transposase-like protein